MYIKAGNTHIIHNRTIERVYDELIRVVYTNGKNITDQRGNEVRQLKHVWTEITTDDITFPSFGPTNQRYGDKFGINLIIGDNQGHDYTYGERAHKFFNIHRIIKILENNPESRRICIPLFYPEDINNSINGKEVPCATQLYVDIEDDKLDMTLMMRSNDIVSAWPSDVYGFRRLQEYIANTLNRDIGTFRHYANNCHIILNNDGEFVRNHMGLK